MHREHAFEFREHSFLNNSRAEALRGSVLTVRVCEVRGRVWVVVPGSSLHWRGGLPHDLRHSPIMRLWTGSTGTAGACPLAFPGGQPSCALAALVPTPLFPVYCG